MDKGSCCMWILRFVCLWVLPVCSYLSLSSSTLSLLPPPPAALESEDICQRSILTVLCVLEFFCTFVLKTWSVILLGVSVRVCADQCLFSSVDFEQFTLGCVSPPIFYFPFHAGVPLPKVNKSYLLLLFFWVSLGKSFCQKQFWWPYITTPQLIVIYFSLFVETWVVIPPPSLVSKQTKTCRVQNKEWSPKGYKVEWDQTSHNLKCMFPFNM